MVCLFSCILSEAAWGGGGAWGTHPTKNPRVPSAHIAEILATHDYGASLECVFLNDQGNLWLVNLLVLYG